MEANLSAEYVWGLLGQRVKVTYAQEDGQEKRIAVGTLLAFGDGGDFEIVDDDGFVHYCWPMLEVRPLHNDGGGGV